MILFDLTDPAAEVFTPVPIPHLTTPTPIGEYSVFTPVPIPHLTTPTPIGEYSDAIYFFVIYFVNFSKIFLICALY